MAIINYIFWFYLLSILSLNCTSNKVNRANNESEIKYSIDVITKLPIDTFNSSIVYMEDTSRIYYYNGFKIYEDPVIRPQSVTLNDITGDTVSSNNSSKIAGYNYFILKDNSTEGIFYSDRDTAMSKKISVESFMKGKSFRYNFRSSVDSVIKKFNYLTRTKLTNNTFVDKFIPINKIDNSYSDTLAFYYYQDTSLFSKSFLSEFLDTVPNYRLRKVVSVNKSYFVIKENRNEYSEISVGFQQFSAVNTSKLNSIVDKFSSYLQQ